ncbi:MAG: site-specific DNA-methyltransferase [Planctomycetota bacterium]|nr:site-specific DNA-methyltransferase [Planctomycetota bacterium]
MDIHFGNNLDILAGFDDASFELIYIDPPFNTGKSQARTQLKTYRDADGDRTGFKGQRYTSVVVGSKAYDDTFDDYLAFIEPRMREAKRLLTPEGSLFFHIDPRESHYCKILLDQIFGRECFINEIIWSYDYGARSKKRWSAKHDTIFWYANDPKHYTFNYDAIDRIPYMAPGLVGAEKAAIGKTPTDVWWNTIVSPTGKEKTGYPTQKPIRVLERIVTVHSNPGDRVLDFFAGSGTTGEAAWKHGRDAVLIDSNTEAIEIMAKRLVDAKPTIHSLNPTAQPAQTRVLAEPV